MKKKKNSEACEGIFHSPHIHPLSWTAEITNYTAQIRSRSFHSFHRKLFQKNILRVLFSPNIAHHEWILLRLTWHSDLGINKKWWKVQPFPFYDVEWNDRTGNPYPKWLATTSGFIIVSKVEGSLNPFRLFFLPNLHGKAFPITLIQISVSFYLRSKSYIVGFFHVSSSLTILVFKLEHLKNLGLYLYSRVYSYLFSVCLTCFIFFYFSILDFLEINPIFLSFVSTLYNIVSLTHTLGLLKFDISTLSTSQVTQGL